MKALIIDDDPGVREALKMTLRAAKLDSVLAEDGPSGLAALLKGEVGLVFLDIKMPGKDGMEVLGEIRAQRPDMPVIMISGHGTIETAVNATKQGAFDFLEKPLDRDRVLLVTRNALQQTELLRENLKLKAREATRILGESAAVRDMLASRPPTPGCSSPARTARARSSSRGGSTTCRPAPTAPSST